MSAALLVNLESLAKHRLAYSTQPAPVVLSMQALQHRSPNSFIQSAGSWAANVHHEREKQLLLAALEELAADPSASKKQRRDALIALAELVERVPHASNMPLLYKLAVQALREPDTSWQPWFADAVLRLVQSMAASCCHKALLQAHPPAGAPPVAQGSSSSLPTPAPPWASTQSLLQAAAYGGELLPPPRGSPKPQPFHADSAPERVQQLGLGSIEGACATGAPSPPLQHKRRRLLHPAPPHATTPEQELEQEAVGEQEQCARAPHAATSLPATTAAPPSSHGSLPHTMQQHEAAALPLGTQQLILAAQRAGNAEAGGQGRGLSWAHAQALQRGLLAWCAHWHPRVRRAAMSALLAAHQHPARAAQQPQRQQQQQQQQQGTQAVQHLQQVLQQGNPTPHQEHPGPSRSFCVCTSIQCVQGSYKAAVLALGDDFEGVRVLALRLLVALVQKHPRLHLQDPRFWQFNRSQPLADDGFQRLCSAAANDPEMGVRRAALQWLQEIQGASLRVKLQALNKKATIRVEVPAGVAAAEEGTKQGQIQKKGKGKQQQGAVLTGRMGGGPWAGAPHAHTLDLLDASVGALVHCTEDELSQVRAAAAGALAALGASELLEIASMPRPAAHVAWEGAADARGQAADPDVLLERRQAACQCSEYLVDLLHDEVQAVREAAARGLLQLAALARSGAARAHQRSRGSAASSACPLPRAAFNARTPAGPEAIPAIVATAADADGGAAADDDGPLLAVLLDREQMLSLISSLCDPSPTVRSCTRSAIPYMSLSTPALMRSLVFALAQNGRCYPEEADDARRVAKVFKLALE